MRKENLSTKQMTEVSLLIAIAVVVELITMALPIPRMPQGGSITLTMLPLVIIAYRHGLKIGIIGGMVYGLLDLLIGGLGLFHWGSLFFDYLIAFGAMGLAALAFRIDKNSALMFLLGILIAGLVRFVSHYLSGVIFFGEFAPEGTPIAWYAFTYNAWYMFPSIAITMIIGILVFIRMRHILQS